MALQLIREQFKNFFPNIQILLCASIIYEPFFSTHLHQSKPFDYSITQLDNEAI